MDLLSNNFESNTLPHHNDVLSSFVYYPEAEEKIFKELMQFYYIIIRAPQ